MVHSYECGVIPNTKSSQILAQDVNVQGVSRAHSSLFWNQKAWPNEFGVSLLKYCHKFHFMVVFFFHVMVHNGKSALINTNGLMENMSTVWM